MGQLLLSLSGCATVIKDGTFCSPFPGPGGTWAACDNFLTKKPQTLNPAQWEVLQQQWILKGWALEVTESDTVGNIKTELEQLCSKTACDDETSQAVDDLVQVLAKMQNTAKKARKLMLQ
jgi:hypothetical protein